MSDRGGQRQLAARRFLPEIAARGTTPWYSGAPAWITSMVRDRGRCAYVVHMGASWGSLPRTPLFVQNVLLAYVSVENRSERR